MPDPVAAPATKDREYFFSYDPKASLHVHKTEGLPGNLMYILVENQSTFDLIDLPEGNNEDDVLSGKTKRKLRHKSIRTETQFVIFQHWFGG